jgi:hypothetical protein
MHGEWRTTVSRGVFVCNPDMVVTRGCPVLLLHVARFRQTFWYYDRAHVRIWPVYILLCYYTLQICALQSFGSLFLTFSLSILMFIDRYVFLSIERDKCIFWRKKITVAP